MSKSMTKVQVLDENARLRDALEVLERKIVRLETELKEFANYAPAAPVQAAAQPSAQRCEPHPSYWDYVRARREQCRAKGKAVSYKTRDQWEAAVAAHIANS